jgi:hypothetical protein
VFCEVAIALSLSSFCYRIFFFSVIESLSTSSMPVHPIVLIASVVGLTDSTVLNMFR